MALSIGVKDVRKVAALIEDGGFDTAEDAARAVIQECFALYESKARWAVAGQIKWPGTKPFIDTADLQASKVIVGPFGTENQANEAASKLAFSSATGEAFRTMACEYWHGTPAAFYKVRNEARKAKELAARSPFAQELDRRLQWFADNPGALVYEPDPHVGAWDRAHMPNPNDAPSFD